MLRFHCLFNHVPTAPCASVSPSLHFLQQSHTQNADQLEGEFVRMPQLEPEFEHESAAIAESGSSHSIVAEVDNLSGAEHRGSGHRLRASFVPHR